MGLSALAVCGCSSNSMLSEVTSALVKQQFGSSGDAISEAKLNLAYQYLRVQVAGQAAALLVLGYVDPHPGGEIEVWYSANHEVLKTQNGRLVGSAGLATDWLAVRWPQPLAAWSYQPLPNASVFVRERDEMPGYRFNLTDTWQQTLQADGASMVTLPVSLPLEVARRYVWAREAQVGTAAVSLPPSWFALERVDGQVRVAYSFQCLSPTLCLHLQRWPLIPPKVVP